MENFEEFNAKQLKDTFTKQGIHIFNYKEESNYSNGFNKGNISFQIRSNDQIENFSDKCEEIKNELDKKGFHMEEKQEKSIKGIAVGDCVPCNLKWNDPRVRIITEKKASYEKKVMEPNNIKKDRRISNVMVDHSYKKSEASKKADK